MTEKDGHLRNSNSIYSVQLLLLYLLGRNIYLERQLSGFKCSLEIFKFSLEICSSRLDIYLPSFPEDSSLTIPKHPLRQVHIIHSFIHYWWANIPHPPADLAIFFAWKLLCLLTISSVDCLISGNQQYYSCFKFLRWTSRKPLRSRLPFPCPGQDRKLAIRFRILLEESIKHRYL